MRMIKIPKKHTQLFTGMLLLIAAIIAAVMLQLTGIQRVTRENLEQDQKNTTAALVQDMELGFFSKYSEYVAGLAESPLLTGALQAEQATVQRVLNLAVNSTDA